MPIPDPELDLLREMLKDEPGASAFVQVGRELTWRSRYDEALAVLRAGIDASKKPPGEAWEALGEAALKGGQVLKAVGALPHLSSDPEAQEEQARLRVQILEAAGKVADAKVAAEAFLDVHGQDVVVEALLERLTAPPPDVRRRLADPLISVGRAESYAALGRTDRAIRVLRRLWFHYPDDTGLRRRIGELSARPTEAPEDLSDEIDEADLPRTPPPGLRMPSPTSRVVPDPTPDLGDVSTDPDMELTDPAIAFSVEEIRRQIEDRKRQALAATPRPSTTPVPRPVAANPTFVYGEDHSDDEEPTVTLPRSVTSATPAEIERQVQDLRERREKDGRKRRTLIKPGGQP